MVMDDVMNKMMLGKKRKKLIGVSHSNWRI
jgi:hypothetical protein